MQLDIYGLDNETKTWGDEWNKRIKIKAELIFEIALQEQFDPTEESAQKPLSFGPDGRPISWQKIKRGEYIILKKTQLQETEVTLKTLQILLENFELWPQHQEIEKNMRQEEKLIKNSPLVWKSVSRLLSRLLGHTAETS